MASAIAGRQEVEVCYLRILRLKQHYDLAVGWSGGWPAGKGAGVAEGPAAAPGAVYIQVVDRSMLYPPCFMLFLDDIFRQQTPTLTFHVPWTLHSRLPLSSKQPTTQPFHRTPPVASTSVPPRTDYPQPLWWRDLGPVTCLSLYHICSGGGGRSSSKTRDRSSSPSSAWLAVAVESLR